MNGFLISQNAITTNLNRMKNGEGTSHNGDNQNHKGGGRGYGRMSKIKFPKFNGDDVKGWVYTCRQFFKIDGVDDNDRMELVSMHQQFCRRFGENYPWNFKDYQEKFEELLNMVELDEKHAISLFLGGLKNEIILQIRMFTLDSLTDVFYMAKMQEQTLVALKSRYTPLLSNPASKLNSSTSQGVRNVSGNAKPNTIFGGGYDMVLGIQWLATLEDIKCNFKELRMKFKIQGSKVAIRGGHKSTMEWMNDKGTDKNVIHAEFHYMALCVFPKNTAFCMQLEGVPNDVDKEIKEVLDSYADVFEIPTQLPPHRNHDHMIPLVEGAILVYIRPYMHPPTQKDAIESMVKELLEASVIKKSQSYGN
nr:hypothetical protein [Tanacetum cinerariifolium]